MTRSLGCFMFVLLVGMIFGFSMGTSLITHERMITVDSKERQCDPASEGERPDCYYVVFSREGEVYSNRDETMRMKWDSASLQARLHVGETYKVKTSGVRIPFLSTKENIVKIIAQP